MRQKNSLSIILIIFILVFIGWLSLFGEYLQSKYKDITFWGLALFLFISLLYKIPEKFSVVDLSFFIYIFILTLSLNFCENKSVALEHYIVSVMPIPLLYFALRAQDRRFILPVAWGIFFFSSCIVFFGILELIFRKNIIYELWTENPFYHRFIYTNPRLMSTLMHPKVTGSFLLGCLPFSFYLVSNIKTAYKIFVKIFMLMIILVIIFSFSRGNILGLATLSLIYLFLTKKIHYIKFILISLLILITFSSTMLKKEFDFHRFSLSGLFSNWWIADAEKFSITLKMLKGHPVIGTGLNHYRLKFDKYSSHHYKHFEEIIKERRRDPYEWKIPDNMYLSILAETGALGFLSFILFFLFLFKKCFVILKTNKDVRIRGFMIACFCGIIGLLISMGTYDLFYWINPLLLFWLLVCALRAVELYAQY